MPALSMHGRHRGLRCRAARLRIVVPVLGRPRDGAPCSGGSAVEMARPGGARTSNLDLEIPVPRMDLSPAECHPGSARRAGFPLPSYDGSHGTRRMLTHGEQMVTLILLVSPLPAYPVSVK